MGHGAQATRRALIDTVKDCVSQTNTLTALIAELREANNRLAKQTGTDVIRVDGRLDALAAWCTRTEQAVTAERDARVAAVDAVRVEVHLILSSLTLRERVRWVVIGRLPVLPPFLLAQPRVEIAKTSNTGQMSGSVMPAVSLGPRVLP